MTRRGDSNGQFVHNVYIYMRCTGGWCWLAGGWCSAERVMSFVLPNLGWFFFSPRRRQDFANFQGAIILCVARLREYCVLLRLRCGTKLESLLSDSFLIWKYTHPYIVFTTNCNRHYVYTLCLACRLYIHSNPSSAAHPLDGATGSRGLICTRTTTGLGLINSRVRAYFRRFSVLSF